MKPRRTVLRWGFIVWLVASASWGGSWVAASSDWPQWHGPNRDGHLPVGAALPPSLPKELAPAWKIAIGSGHSSPVVADDRLVYLDEQGGQEVAHVVDTATGKEQWRAPFAEGYGDEWGRGPRSTPFVDGDRVYAQSCRGEFACLRLADGTVVWHTSFEKDFGVRFVGGAASEGTATRRGNNGCGVIDGLRLFLPVGSTNGASLVCFDKITGTVLWKSGNDEAAYSALIIATLAGQKQLVAFTADALLGAEIESGRTLWRVPLKTDAKRHAATPVAIGNTVAVNSHTLGLVCFRIAREGAGFKATEAWANRKLKINLATPVLVENHLYCQGANKDYICVEAATGELKWSQPGFGRGQKDYASTIGAADRLLVLNEEGTLLLLAANPSRYTELGRLQVCGHTWCFPAFSAGRLFVRDSQSLLCIPLITQPR